MWNKDEWVNDLIEEISVKIQDQEISTIDDIRSHNYEKVTELCGSVRKCCEIITVFHEAEFEYTVENIDSSNNLYSLAKYSVLVCTENELDFNDLLETNKNAIKPN